MPNVNASTATTPFDPIQTVIDAANAYGVDPDFALRIAHQESGINPNVRDSSAGAIGTMQLMPGTAKDLGVDPRDKTANIYGGVRYLKQLQDQFGNNPSIVAGAYNAGPGRMRSYLAGRADLPAETQNYITSVSNSPMSARVLGYTSAPSAAAAPSVQNFVANPTQSAQPAAGGNDWIAAPNTDKAPSATAAPTGGDNADDWIAAPDASKAPGAAGAGGANDWITLPGAPAASTTVAAPSSRPSSLMDVLRSIGSGLRGAAEGTAGLPGDLEAGVNWVGNKVLPLPSGAAQPGSAGAIPAPPTSAQIDKGVSAIAGPAYQPRTKAGDYAKTIAEFAPAAIGGEGGVVRRAAQVVVPAVSSQAAGDAAAAAGASPGVQDAIRVAMAIGAGAPLSRPTTGPVNQVVAAADRLGVKVPRYMASDGPVLPQLAQGAKAVPLAGSPITNSASKLSQGLEDAINTIAPNTPAEAAGRAAKAGLTKSITKDAPAQVSAMYDTVDNAITNPNARVPLTNTAQKMQQLMAARDNANLPEWGPAMKTLAAAVTDPKGMNYAGIKQLRSYFGETMPDQLIAEGLSPGETKQLYGPLTQDLQSAVLAGGGQPALDAWTQANTLAKLKADQREQLYKIIGTDGDTAPEAVFGRLSQLAGTKSTADIALLRQAKQAMGPQAWQQVGNATISRLGRDAQGNFSPDRFIGPNGYAGLSDQAKGVLFTPQQRSALDDLNTVSNRVNEKISKFANTSRTAHVSQAAELLGGLWLHPVGTVVGIAGTRTAAHLLAMPAVAQAAVRLGRAQLAGSVSRATLAHNALASAIVANQLPTTGQQ